MKNATHPLQSHVTWSMGLIFMLPMCAHAVEKDTGTAVVARLYKDFAWQAIVSSDQPSESTAAFGHTLAAQSESTLNKYFDAGLTSLLVRDAKCVRRTRELCNLEFDPIFASQDSGATDLVVKASGPGQVTVRFKYPSNKQETALLYRVSQIAGQWKISDISYESIGGDSLKTLLMRKLP